MKEGRGNASGSNPQAAQQPPYPSRSVNDQQDELNVEQEETTENKCGVGDQEDSSKDGEVGRGV